MESDDIKSAIFETSEKITGIPNMRQSTPSNLKNGNEEGAVHLSVKRLDDGIDKTQESVFDGLKDHSSDVD